jgi:hypothetical protein
MKDHTKPVKPKDLGLIGQEHLRSRFKAAGADLRSFRYSRQLVLDEELPAVIETGFGYCPEGGERQIVAGVNWSPGINNPFRVIGRNGKSLDTYLSEQRVGDDGEPVALIIHLACPRVDYTDRKDRSCHWWRTR